MNWKVITVRQEGELTGPEAGRTWRLLVEFPWGQEEREFAPTLTLEDIRNTLDSIVRDRSAAKQRHNEMLNLSKQLPNLRSKS